MPVSPPRTEIFLTEVELAVRWRTSRRTLQRKRALGGAPPFHLLNNRILYALPDVLEFEELRRKDAGQ